MRPSSLLAARLASLIAAFLALAAAAEPPAYPQSPRKPVTDTYQGVEVRDDYRWLENGDDPAVVAWSKSQTELARKVLDAIPQRAGLVERFQALYGEAPVRYYDFQQRGRFFAMKRQPPKNQPLLVVMKAPGDAKSERVLVDPNRRDAKGTTAIDWYRASFDGRYVAVSLSEKGSEDGSAHVFEVATGRELADVVPRVQWPTGGGSLEWDAKGTGFYYTRYPHAGERPAEDANFYQQVWFHRLGTSPDADTYVIGKEFPRIAETALEATPDGRWLLASVANGDGGEFAFWLRDPAGAWKKIAANEDKIRHVDLGRDGRLYALSLAGAPRGKVIALDPAHPRLEDAKLVVAESEGTIEAVTATRNRVYVTYMVGGPSEIRVFDRDGKALGTVPTEPVSDVNVGERLAGDDILVGSQSFLTPLSWYRYGAASKRLAKVALAGTWKVRFDDAEVVREMATSRDGTKVPVNLVMKKGTKRDGSSPLLLTGYGGYGVSMRPWFSPALRVWLDHGGVYALANLRGGGEFGEAWHLGGNLTHKQNVFDDMIACAQYVVARGYTTPARLAAEGGSNGGLLMGALLTQRPELFRAIVGQVGIYDMLRVELSPNGAFNVTEFGTVKDPEQFKALYAYSPYHHVKDGTRYPAVLFTAGAHDGRVDPAQSRKMAARLQAANASGHPILLRIDLDTGHGMGTALAKRIEQSADSYAFLIHELGMP